jgi:AraC family transcriptional regulator
MKLTPRIENLSEIYFAGLEKKVSPIKNRTRELWQEFMPRLKEIPNRIGVELYSVEVFDNISFFKDFNTETEFMKWAAVRVTDLNQIPSGMNSLTIPEGIYAVFLYKGKPSKAAGTFDFIFNTWLPDSPYTIDSRPHLAVMGENYKGEHPDSEEELWIPVMKKKFY